MARKLNNYVVITSNTGIPMYGSEKAITEYLARTGQTITQTHYAGNNHSKMQDTFRRITRIGTRHPQNDKSK